MTDPVNLLDEWLRRLEAARQRALREGDVMRAIVLTRCKATLVGAPPARTGESATKK
jgi:hypothetical protein